MGKFLVKRKLIWKGVSLLEGEVVEISGDDLKDGRIGKSLLSLDEKAARKREEARATAKKDGETLEEYRRMIAAYGQTLPPDAGVEEARKLYERVSSAQRVVRKTVEG